MTEKETDEWLETEIREIPMPDGSFRSFTGFKLMWRGYDYIQDTSHIDAQTLTEWTLLFVKQSGHSFDRCFPNIVSYVHQALRKRQGID